jgi:hypothetical protein
MKERKMKERKGKDHQSEVTMNDLLGLEASNEFDHPSLVAPVKP